MDLDKKNIGVVHFYGSGFPPEIRIEKQSPVLLSLGFKIFLITDKISNAEQKKEIYRNNFIIERVEKKKVNIFSKILSKFTLFSPEYEDEIKTFIERNNITCVIVHDIFHLRSVLKLVKRYNIPVIADLHENMPAAFVAYRFNDKIISKILKTIIYNYYLLRWHEKKLLEKCALILVTANEAKLRLLEYGLNNEKICLVSNTEDETTFDTNKFKSDVSILERYSEFWVIGYIGSVGPHRGIDTTIKALGLISHKIPNIRLLIVGCNPVMKSYYMKLAIKLNVQSLIEIIEWIPFDSIKNYIDSCDVCLVPHNNFEHTNTTVPHKLFQYMMLEKPVLVSSCPPLKQVVEDSECGRVFEAGNSNDMSKKMYEMFKDSNFLNNMGKNGKRAALTKYSWKNDAERLKKAVKNIMLNIVVSD